MWTAIFGLVGACAAIWVCLLSTARRVDRLEEKLARLQPPDPDEVGVDRADFH